MVTWGGEVELNPSDGSGEDDENEPKPSERLDKLYCPGSKITEDGSVALFEELVDAGLFVENNAPA